MWISKPHCDDHGQIVNMTPDEARKETFVHHEKRPKPQVQTGSDFEQTLLISCDMMNCPPDGDCYVLTSPVLKDNKWYWTHLNTGGNTMFPSNHFPNHVNRWRCYDDVYCTVNISKPLGVIQGY